MRLFLPYNERCMWSDTVDVESDATLLFTTPDRIYSLFVIIFLVADTEDLNRSLCQVAPALPVPLYIAPSSLASVWITHHIIFFFSHILIIAYGPLVISCNQPLQNFHCVSESLANGGKKYVYFFCINSSYAEASFLPPVFFDWYI